MSAEQAGLSTLCVHAGVDPSIPKVTNGPIQPSIAQSTIFDLGSSADAEAIFSGVRAGYSYSRFGNPTVDELGRAVAALEGGKGALVTSSGNAATFCAVTAAMEGRSGPLVTHHDVYGGSFELAQILRNSFRMEVEIVDSSDREAWREAVGRAGAVLLETPSNPLMRLIDLQETVERARTAGASVIVDNTVATPYNQRPLEHGVDWVTHSTTKYINGHSDLVGGCVVKRETLTARDKSIHKNIGGVANAFDAWLALRGLRTFALRMEAHNRNGETIAGWLRGRPEVRQVFYAGSADHPQAEIFKKQMTSGGALISFELAGGATAAMRFLDRVRLIAHAVSLGGIESLATRPAMSSHRGMPPEAREASGVTEGLIRLSVGIESPEDIISDLEQALAND